MHSGLPNVAVTVSVCPSQVLLMAGTNDLKRRSAAEITSSLEQLHATCHAAGARTLALAIPHSKASTVGSRGRSERRREVHAGLLLSLTLTLTLAAGLWLRGPPPRR